MKKLKRFLLLFFIVSVCSIATYCQAKYLNITEEDKLKKLISSNIIRTKKFSETKASELFSIKFLLANNKEVDSIFISDRAPQEMIGKLRNLEIYNKIDWKAILGREVRKGDIVLIPIAIFPADTFASFPSYTQSQLDDLFKYNKSGNGFNCYFMNILLLSGYVEQI